MITNKRLIPGWEKLEWNTRHEWAIPLPAFPVDGNYVVKRWYVPDETPVIPTGWIYELARGEVLCQSHLYGRHHTQG